MARRASEPTVGRIALATHRAQAVAAEDDALALALLAARGLGVRAVAWDASDAGWDRYDAVLVRSTWDYHLRPAEFVAWAERIESMGVALWNPAAVIRWNVDKGYLRGLERDGVPVVPTEWIPRGADADLGGVLRRRGWQRAVVKPSVGATSHRTRVVDLESAASRRAWLSATLDEADALVQPFLPQVRREGEWSFVFFDDGDGRLAFSHAVLKRAGGRDFRVQAEFGGTVEAANTPTELLAQVTDVARAVVRAAPGPLLYARLDGIVGDGVHVPRGTFALTEAELIEPVLFLGYAKGAAGRFADAVARRVAAPRDATVEFDVRIRRG